MLSIFAAICLLVSLLDPSASSNLMLKRKAGQVQDVLSGRLMCLNMTWATFKDLGQRSQLFRTTPEAGHTMITIRGNWASAGQVITMRIAALRKLLLLLFLLSVGMQEHSNGSGLEQ